jgi:hypothetical protein
LPALVLRKDRSPAYSRCDRVAVKRAARVQAGPSKDAQENGAREVQDGALARRDRCVSLAAMFVTLVPHATAAADSASQTAVVPGYVPFALFLVLETAAVLVWVLVFARRRTDDSDALLVCSRCVRLRERTEAFGRGADAVAVGALAFLVALPFVAAGYESGFTFPNTVLAISAVAAVVAVAAEADFLARAAAARLWPNFTWSAEPARIIGGGARWLGAILVLYLFQPRDAGIAALLGNVGERLVVDLSSTRMIMVAAAILAGSCIVSLAARWLVPVVFGSLPTTLAPRRDLHGTVR